MGVLGAMLSGFAYNAIRNMKDKEDADVIIFYHPLISLPIVIGYLLIFPQNFVMPHGSDWIFLIGTGVFTQVGQYFITRAYQQDTAARISSVSYIGIIWGVLMGKFLFDDTYPPTVLLGMTVVLSGVLLNLNALHVRKMADKIKALFVGD
jgi:drug/metabolite transporter (DMT)-like permease